MEQQIKLTRHEVENIEPEVQEQVKEVETPKAEATKEEKKSEPDDAVKELNRTFLKMLESTTYATLAAAEFAEEEASKRLDNAKWYNRRRLRKEFLAAMNMKFEAAGAVYYMEKIAKEIKKEK